MNTPRPSDTPPPRGISADLFKLSAPGKAILIEISPRGGRFPEESTVTGGVHVSGIPIADDSVTHDVSG